MFDTSQKNVGKGDRLVRFIVGALLILIAVNNSSVFAAIVGLVLIGTAYMRFCPTYTAMKIDTNTSDTPAPKPVKK
ncbi:MAG TPA: DUF2892 domain-containing protein [Lamprocystis sp. (in: g-proteobacteria)]|nr:DUF2892 domain-containing protein [Lamprocystis sp. (in: g-proteobacteria)]